MNRRNFLQLLGAAALCSMAGIKPAVRASTEAEDRAIRLARMAQDHQDLLAEMRMLNELRLAQIEEAFDAELDELARRTDEWTARTMSMRVAPGAISVYAAPGATPQEIAQAVNIEMRLMGLTA